jgi:hypothetical protein
MDLDFNSLSTTYSHMTLISDSHSFSFLMDKVEVIIPPTLGFCED